jgi:CubicO group peptidase (beta-lactamase class C family)
MGRQGNAIPAIILAALLVGSAGAEAVRGQSGRLVELLEPIRVKYDLPALAGAVVLEGYPAMSGATGFRKYGSEVRVTSEDKFHIGSCTKAMTATIVGMLVERGKLRLEMTLGEVLPELREQIHVEYQDVTLRHLLAHRAGLPGASRSWPEGKSFRDMHNLLGSTTQQRLAYARMMLGREPAAKPGTRYLYSNAGYSILGLIAERTMKKPWEKLMEEMLFKPLGMESAGFGAMGTPGKVDEPWQHRMNDNEHRAIEPGRFSDNPPVLGPGGTAHCSIGDWAKFVAAHLAGGTGKAKLLKRETLEMLHRPDFGGDYAAGWQIANRDWAGGKVLTHSGSNTMSYAVVWMAPKRNFAVLVASNQGGGGVEKGCDEAAWTLIKEFLLKNSTQDEQ